MPQPVHTAKPGQAAPAAARPRLFIGSSSEQIDVAHGLQANLDRFCDVTVWDQGAFALSGTILDDLLARLHETDFAVFAFGPDDLVTMRGTTRAVTRDNVVFELGLAIGVLGKRRTFVVMPRARGDLQLPSDIVGLTPAEYDATRPELRSALGPACLAIREQVGLLGLRPERGPCDVVTVNSVLVVVLEGSLTPDWERDVAILEREFPGCVTVRHPTSKTEFATALHELRPDILHVIADIDVDDGALAFGKDPLASDWRTEDEPFKGRIKLAADQFAVLLERQPPTLTVLASCDSVLTADRIGRVTNAVGVSGKIYVDRLMPWQDAFYAELARGESCRTAFGLASAVEAAGTMLRLRRDFTVARPA